MKFFPIVILLVPFINACSFGAKPAPKTDFFVSEAEYAAEIMVEYCESNGGTATIERDARDVPIKVHCIEHI